MDTDAILEEYTARAGWNRDSIICLLTQYIENQKSPEAFEDFLREQVEEEESHKIL